MQYSKSLKFVNVDNGTNSLFWISKRYKVSFPRRACSYQIFLNISSVFLELCSRASATPDHSSRLPEVDMSFGVGLDRFFQSPQMSRKLCIQAARMRWSIFPVGRKTYGCRSLAEKKWNEKRDMHLKKRSDWFKTLNQCNRFLTGIIKLNWLQSEKSATTFCKC